MQDAEREDANDRNTHRKWKTVVRIFNETVPKAHIHILYRWYILFCCWRGLTQVTASFCLPAPLPRLWELEQPVLILRSEITNVIGVFLSEHSNTDITIAAGNWKQWRSRALTWNVGAETFQNTALHRVDWASYDVEPKWRILRIWIWLISTRTGLYSGGAVLFSSKPFASCPSAFFNGVSDFWHDEMSLFLY